MISVKVMLESEIICTKMKDSSMHVSIFYQWLNSVREHLQNDRFLQPCLVVY